jgi:uncharacterized protein (TIGR00106 family)
MKLIAGLSDYCIVLQQPTQGGTLKEGGIDMGKVIAEVVIVPHGTGSTSLSPYVAEVEKILRSYDLKVMLTPMGTILEGELDTVLKAVRAAHEAPFKAGALRVGTTIRIDDRRDKNASMEQKVKSVEEKLKD